jgi:hypothetical protein
MMSDAPIMRTSLFFSTWSNKKFNPTTEWGISFSTLREWSRRSVDTNSQRMIRCETPAISMRNFERVYDANSGWRAEEWYVCKVHLIQACSRILSCLSNAWYVELHQVIKKIWAYNLVGWLLWRTLPILFRWSIFVKNAEFYQIGQNLDCVIHFVFRN